MISRHQSAIRADAVVGAGRGDESGTPCEMFKRAELNETRGIDQRKNHGTRLAVE